MTYILHDVLQSLKSLFLTTPLGNTQPSLYLEAITRLKAQDPPGKEVYASIERIYSLAPTIDEYVDLLEKAIGAIRSEKVFSFGGSELQPTEVALRRWYLNRRGEYVDPETWFIRFVERACELLELFERMELVPPDSTAMERSRERLLLLVNNLIEFSAR